MPFADVQGSKTGWICCAVYKLVARRLDGRSRLLFLQEMHGALGNDLDLGSIGSFALNIDDLPCLLYTHANGVFPYGFPVTLAAQVWRGVNFRIWAPTCNKVFLVRHDPGALLGCMKR
jgi:hypothetical protein